MILSTSHDAIPRAAPRRVLDDAVRLGTLERTGLLDALPEVVFDDAAALATRVLGVPVSLLSLVDDKRQVFKALHGLKGWAAEARETPLSHSFCQHVVTTGETLAVEDARTDPRLVGNRAIEDLGVVAYLGVPVTAPNGAVLGSFCAISGQPRAWSEDDRENLAAIARGVQSEIALRLAARDLKAERDAVRAERELLRTIVDELPVGLAVASVPDGAIKLVNLAGERLLAESVEADEAADYARLGAQHPDGRRYHAEDYPLVRSATGGEEVAAEPMIYRRGDGRVVRLEVSSRRIASNPPLAVATYVDVTERDQARGESAAAQARLNHTLEASADGIAVIKSDWTFGYLNEVARRLLGGGADLVGARLWDVGAGDGAETLMAPFTAALRHGRPARVEQAGADDRWLEWRAYPSQGELTVFIRDVSEERRAEAARELLVRELNHRVKNLFAIVSGMVNMTARSTGTPAEMATALRGRIKALATAHEIIRPAVTRESQLREDASLRELAEAIIAPHADGTLGQVRISGASVMLGPTTATNLSLVLHELATNAAKYGALSCDTGRLHLGWTSRGDQVEIVWSEAGCLAREGEPEGKGFGSRLIDTTVRGQLGGTLERVWSEDGTTLTLTFPSAALSS